MQITIATSSKNYSQRSRQRIIEFKKHHADQFASTTENTAETAPTLPVALRPCRVSWQNVINVSRPLQSGLISFIDEEKRYGFITNDTGRFHFKFNAFMRGKPELNAQVEFEAEESYDKKHDQKGFSAVNIRPARIPAQVTIRDT